MLLVMWFEVLGRPVQCQELGLMIVVGPFQLKIFYDSVIKSALLKPCVVFLFFALTPAFRELKSTILRSPYLSCATSLGLQALEGLPHSGVPSS